MDSVWWLFLVCAVVLCTVMAGATDAPLEQRRINQLSVCLSVHVSIRVSVITTMSTATDTIYMNLVGNFCCFKIVIK